MLTNIQMDQDRSRRFFFTLRMFTLSLLFTNFTIGQSFSLSQWQACMAWASYIYAYFSKYMVHFILWCTIQIESRRDSWTFTQQHPLYKIWDTFRSYQICFKFLKYPIRSFTSVVSYLLFVKLASVCRTLGTICNLQNSVPYTCTP